MHRSERSSIVHHRRYRDEYGINEQTSAISTDKIGVDNQESRIETSSHDNSTNLPFAVKLLESGKLSNIAGQVLQALINVYPYIASEEDFFHIWPDVSENHNLLWQHVKRLRKLGLNIHRHRAHGYSLNPEPLFQNKPSWAAHLSSQEEILLAALNYQSGQLNLTDIANLLGYSNSHLDRFSRFQHQDLVINIIQLAMSRLRRKFRQHHIGTIESTKYRSGYRFIIVAEHSQEAISENR